MFRDEVQVVGFIKPPATSGNVLVDEIAGGTVETQHIVSAPASDVQISVRAECET